MGSRWVFFLFQMKLIVTIPGANPSLWPQQRGAELLGGQLTPDSGVCQHYQMPGRGRT